MGFYTSQFRLYIGSMSIIRISYLQKIRSHLFITLSIYLPCFDNNHHFVLPFTTTFVPEISRPLERKTPWNFIESKSKTLQQDIPPCFWWIPKQVCFQYISSGLPTVKYLNLLKLNCCIFLIFLLCIWGGVTSVSFGY